MRVAVTGIGMVNAIGSTSNTAWNSLLSKTCGISRVDSKYQGIGGLPSFNAKAWDMHLKVLIN